MRLESEGRKLKYNSLIKYMSYHILARFALLMLDSLLLDRFIPLLALRCVVCFLGADFLLAITEAMAGIFFPD